MVLRTLVRFAAGKRVPLIKFRKGGNAAPAAATSDQASSSPSSPVPAAAASAAPAANQASTRSGNAIEDWELPRRYWRKPIDQDEMEYINRGGPA